MSELIRNLHWALYYEFGWTWLPKAEPREWRVLLLQGMDPPPPRVGYEQIVARIPEHMAALFGAPQRCEAGYDHAQTACPVHQPFYGWFGGGYSSGSLRDNPQSALYRPRRFDDI